MKSKLLMMAAIWMVASAPSVTSWATAAERMVCLIAAFFILTVKEWEGE